jgi:hypothetical protein
MNWTFIKIINFMTPKKHGENNKPYVEFFKGGFEWSFISFFEGTK